MREVLLGVSGSGHDPATPDGRFDGRGAGREFIEARGAGPFAGGEGRIRAVRRWAC